MYIYLYKVYGINLADDVNIDFGNYSKYHFNKQFYRQIISICFMRFMRNGNDTEMIVFFYSYNFR